MEKYFCVACESIWINNRQCVETIWEEPKLKWVIDGNELSFLVTTLLARFQYG